MKLRIILIFLLCPLGVNAMDLGTSFGVGDGTYLMSFHGSFRGQRFLKDLELGIGGRYTAFFGSDYTTNPVIDTEQEIIIQNPMVHAVNISFFSSYKLTNSLMMGFNIDLLGLSFGPARPSSDFSNGFDGSPTQLNIFKGASNDEGTLNSEFWLGYLVSSKILLKAGFAHFVGEYETTQSQTDGNNRFRKFNNFLFIGINFT